MSAKDKPRIYPTDYPYFVFRQDGLRATTLALAEQLGLDHMKFFQAIEAQMPHISPGFQAEHFFRQRFQDQSGMVIEYYEVTNSGFAMLPINTRRPGVGRWVIRYLEAFTQFEEVKKDCALAQAFFGQTDSCPIGTINVADAFTELLHRFGLRAVPADAVHGTSISLPGAAPGSLH
jgi:hypothetical protein